MNNLIIINIKSITTLLLVPIQNMFYKELIRKILFFTLKNTKNTIQFFFFLRKTLPHLNCSKCRDITLQKNQSLSHSSIYSNTKETLFYKTPVDRVICTLHNYNTNSLIG